MRKLCQYTRPGIGLPVAWSVADDTPGKAAQCSAVAPSCHCRLLTANGITPSAGLWSLTDANNPVCDSFVGKSAFRAPPSFVLDGVHRAAVVVEEVQLAVLVLAEGDDAHRRPRDLRHLLGAVALEAGGPQASRFPVAEDVGSAQLRELLAAVDEPAGDAAGDRVRQLDQGRDGSASARPVSDLIGCGPSIADQP